MRISGLLYRFRLNPSHWWKKHLAGFPRVFEFFKITGENLHLLRERVKSLFQEEANTPAVKKFKF
jgi:hypothetical protein